MGGEQGSFHFVATHVGDDATVSLIGELDFAVAPRLEQLFEVLRDDGAVHVVIDLTELRYVGSVGIGVLASALEQQRARGGDLVLRAPSGEVQLLLRIMQLDETFTIER